MLQPTEHLVVECHSVEHHSVEYLSYEHLPDEQILVETDSSPSFRLRMRRFSLPQVFTRSDNVPLVPAHPLSVVADGQNNFRS